ncbi:MAG TPA: sensor histidine kinase, partial [Symbiobacteriaceae bacterium]|nr:sensor histidine kinase [Symbiobacteriaceae bacterium]
TIASLTAAEVKILGRYLLGFPSALLSAWGLLRQVPALRRNKCPRLGHLYGAAVCFVLYGIVGGLIVPQGDLLLAGIINESSFLQLAGVPVEVARGLTMLGVTYYTVRLLDIFNLETQRRLQMAEQDRALLRERERIAGELHDGIMQTLYGTGLGLKQVTTLSRTQPDQAHAILTELNKEISRAILQMRRFVLDLKEHTISVAELVDAVRSQTSDIGQFAGIPIAFQQDLTECAAYAVPAGLREEVLALVREGLSNVVRHAQAGAARVVLGLDDDTVLVRVSDNGCGFDPVALESGRALDSLRERVEALGGFMQVHSTPGEGTDLVAHLPLTPGKRRGRTKEMTA